nr:SUMF1/EgtB/PvdO family nonheme iron enzyme [uncultured Limnohabitans sp.]
MPNCKLSLSQRKVLMRQIIASFFVAAAHAQASDRVALPGFALDRTEVTIGQFERYVRATGSVTRAEKEGGGFEYGAGWERRLGWTWRALAHRR